MPSIPTDVEPYRQFNFKLEVDSIEIGGFQKVSGLTVQMETIEYKEGGVNEYVHTLPGQVSHNNLLLEKGLTNKTVLWDWIADAKAPDTKPEDARRNVRLKLQAGYKADQIWGWQFQHAYPVQWDGPDLRSDQSGSNVAIQSLELAHDGFTKLSGTP
jgi:phage tail-like protein